MTDGQYPHELIHRAVTARAAERPEATALVHDGTAYTYRTLDAASDAYAVALAERGIQPGHIVPFILPRSPHLVALQLAVLKCGAAYVNLDSSWPPQRQMAIIEQVRPHLTIARGTPAFTGTVDALDPGYEDLRAVASRQAAFASPPAESSDPATVFFTSGTTGGPKGIIVPHRAVTRLFRDDGLAGFGPGHVMPQAAALPWDMYAFEVWGQLTAGGSLVFGKYGHLTPSALAELIATAGVDTVWLTTTLFNLFVDEGLECFDGARQVYVGGEKLSSAHVQAFLRRYPHMPLHNGYGPAENCMLTTTRRIVPADCGIPRGIPVGVAVPGSKVFVLGDLDKHCGLGEAGEVCAAGDGLAIGYLDQPALTAEKFPSVQIDGIPTRIYRTGDIGFFDDEGVLHFLGRVDRQVKINGHRIELAEVESAARELDVVHECVAIPLKDDNGRAYGLALCYTSGTGQQHTEASSPSDSCSSSEPEVRRALRHVLPAHLIPSVLRRIDRFPMTLNGKVDLNLLTDAVAAPRRGAAKERGA